MTTNERNAATLNLLAPLALPIAEALAALIATLATVIRSLKADRAARRTLNDARARTMARPGPASLTPNSIPYASAPLATLVPTAPALPLTTALPELTEANVADEVYSVAACRMIGRHQWQASDTGLAPFSVTVERVEPTEAPAVDPAPASAAPIARQCVATTKRGVRCSRKATSVAGCFCTQHDKAGA